MNVGWTYFSIGRSDGALDQAGKMIEIEPDFYGAYWLNGAIRLTEGRYGDAVEELKRAVSLGGHQVVLADLASAYGLAARREDAATILDQLLEMRRRQYVPSAWRVCTAGSERQRKRSSGWRRRLTSETARWCFWKERLPGPRGTIRSTGSAATAE
jgi:tetratricopeptide (TPR) repeat protein